MVGITNLGKTYSKAYFVTLRIISSCNILTIASYGD